MLNVIDNKWAQGEYLSFKDEGPISPGSVTHKFSVTSRHSGALLGYVKWFNQWRKYCFFSVEAIFDAKCLEDIRTFLEIATDYHRAESKTPMQVFVGRSRT
jgi:hypothetical protein